MDDEYRDVTKICPAPNGKFYVLCQAHVVCTPAGALHYFETERDAQLFLAEIDDAGLAETIFYPALTLC